MVLAWENLHEDFVMLIVLVVVVLAHWRFFIFIAFWRHPLPFRELSLGFYTHFMLSAKLIVEWFATLSFQFFWGFPSQLYSECYGRFLTTSVFYFAFLHHLLARFCNSDAGRNTPSRILVCVYPHKVVLSGWRMILNYSYCRYKTICLSIALVSHEV